MTTLYSKESATVFKTSPENQVNVCRILGEEHGGKGHGESLQFKKLSLWM